jgi:hypothetical protein
VVRLGGEGFWAGSETIPGSPFGSGLLGIAARDSEPEGIAGWSEGLGWMAR